MNLKFSILAIVALSFSIFFSACNETTNIGSSILDQDLLNTEFSDTVSLRTLTIQGDSLVTYFPSSSNSRHPGGFLFGNFVDPVFGRTNASVYTEINPSNEDIPEGDIIVDSVILELPYFENGIYGAVENPMDIQVFKIEEGIQDTIIYSFETKPLGEQIGAATVTPIISADSFDIFFPNETETDSLVNVKVKVPVHLRVPLYNTFGEEILSFEPADTVYQDAELFKENLKGIYIESISDDKGILGLDLLRNNTNPYFSPSIRIFYTYQDTLHSTYAFPIHGEFGNPKFSNIQYDYSNTIVEEYIDNEENSSQYSFVQGGQGLSTQVTIPYTEGFSDRSLLKAELELTVFYFDEDMEADYPPVSAIGLFKDGLSFALDTLIEPIEDVRYSIESSNVEGIFGGTPIEGDMTSGIPYTYKMNITAHLNSLRNGECLNNDMYLTVFTRPQRPGRVVLCGSDHPSHPAKINLYYSN